MNLEVDSISNSFIGGTNKVSMRRRDHVHTRQVPTTMCKPYSISCAWVGWQVLQVGSIILLNQIIAYETNQFIPILKMGSRSYIPM